MNQVRYDTMEDPARWKQLQHGDLDAFGHLYRHYYDFLFRYGISLTQDLQLTEDCIQELYLYLWTHRSGLAQVTSVKFYLLKAFRQRLFRMLGRNHARSERERRYAGGQPGFALPHEASLIEEDARSSRRALLQRMVRELTTRQREVLHLKYYENLSYREIADLLSINYQTAVNHVHEAVRALRRSSREVYTSA